MQPSISGGGKETKMSYETDRQAGARKLYAKRMREEEEARRRREEARKREEERRKAAEQRAEDHRRQMAQKKQTSTADNQTSGAAGNAGAKPISGSVQKHTSAHANTFYTTQADNGIIQPRFNSIAAFEHAIEKQQEALKAMNKQQYNYMLQNDISGMDALDEPIKRAEKDIDDLKMEMYGVMGAFAGSQWGSQQKNNTQATLPDASSDSYLRGMQHAYGNMGEGLQAEQVRKQAGKQKGMLHAYGNVGEGIVAEQARKEAAAQKGMQHAYGNVGDGLVAEQVRKDKNAAYEGMLHAYGNIGDGLAAEEARKDKAEWIMDKLTDLMLDINGMSEVDFNNKYHESGFKSKEEALAKSNEWILELKKLIGEDALVEFWESTGVPKLTMPKSQDPVWAQAPSVFDKDKGTVGIDGNEIPVITTWSNYKDFSDVTKETISLSFDRRNFWEMISQFKVSGEKDSTKTEKYNSDQKISSSAAAVISAAQSMINTKRHFDINVHTVESGGKECAVIEYYDSYLDVNNIFGTGYSTLTKKQNSSQFGATTGYALDGDEYNIDEQHEDIRLTGYLYVNNGRVMVQPVYFLKDKIVDDNKDITNYFFQSFYLDKNAVLLIDAKLKQQGVDLGIDLDLYP